MTIIFSFRRSPPDSLTMKGWLYRRKRMKWSKFWAALGSDNILRFYKDEDCQRQNLPVSFEVNLNGGCNVQNIKQGKSSTYFSLVVNGGRKKSLAGSEDLGSADSFMRARSVGKSNYRTLVLRCRWHCKPSEKR